MASFINEMKEQIQASIPTDSSIIGKVIQTIYNPKSSAYDLAQVIENDPPLTAKILSAANSAYYGQSNTINSLLRAVVLLGFDTIKELTSTITVSQYFADGDQKGKLDRRALWIHSVGTAKAAQIISTRLLVGRPDVAYTAGLLHDIGKITLSVVFPEQYDRVVSLAAMRKARIILAEQRLLNTDHCMVGKVVCEMWNLPADLTNAVFYHNDPRDNVGDDIQLVRTIHIADILARTAEIGNAGDAIIPEPTPASLSVLGATREKIQANYDAVLDELTALKPDIESFFSK